MLAVTIAGPKWPFDPIERDALGPAAGERALGRGTITAPNGNANPTACPRNAPMLACSPSIAHSRTLLAHPPFRNTLAACAQRLDLADPAGDGRIETMWTTRPQPPRAELSQAQP